MLKKMLALIMFALWLSACSSPLFAPATPTPTATSTPTLVPTPTSTLTPTATLTPLPTDTLTPTAAELGTSVKSRDEFEALVKAGQIKCQGSSGGNSAVIEFAEKVLAADIATDAAYRLGSGIPSGSDPSQCVFMMAFGGGQTIIVYQDSEIGEYVTLIVEE
jgi:hypothetical protein